MAHLSTSSPDEHAPPPDPARRHAFFLAYANGTLWALGNGLGSTALIIYLVRQLGAAGLGIGVVLAAPHITGVLRLAAPTLVGRLGSRREVCIACYGASAILLAAIAQLAEPERLSAPALALPIVVALWCAFHLLEYLGTVLLWSWLGDITTQDIRGRFIGIRECCMLFARVIGMLAAGGLSWAWSNFATAADAWVGYAISACLAAAFMMAAILPLARMPDQSQKRDRTDPAFASIFTPLTDVRLLWLLAFGAWFSVANGLTQSAQFLFPIVAFGLPLLARNIYTAGMRLGQAGLAPWVGSLADTFGNRRVLITAQLIVAIGPVFYLLAAWSPGVRFVGVPLSWWILSGAWVAWIAYVGLNVGLPNLMLKLAGPEDKAAYVAWYFAVTGIVYGIATIAGGALYGWLDDLKPVWSIARFPVDHNDVMFTAGFALRLSAIVWLLPLTESKS